MYSQSQIIDEKEKQKGSATAQIDKSRDPISHDESENDEDVKMNEAEEAGEFVTEQERKSNYNYFIFERILTNRRLSSKYDTGEEQI